LDSQRLWAPWRLSYVKGEDKLSAPEQFVLPGGDPNCFLCRAVASDRDRENLVVARGSSTITVLNRYPYNNGHLLVSPLAHQAGLDELTDAEQLEIAASITRMTATVRRLMNADGFNVGLNLGGASGAGVPGHLHWHIVPRWHGDTNFMPVVASTKVIPQSLDELWLLLSGDGESQT